MIKLVKSSFYNEKQTSRELADFIVGSTQLSFGPQCEKFETKFSEYQERLECVFLNSGSSANLAIIQAMLNLGYIHKGDKVGFSALTWSTNVMPLIELGLEAIPIDIELDTLNVSSKMLKKTLTKHDLKMVFLTNLLGWADDIDVIASLCKTKHIHLVEDNCESLGTVYQGKKLGNFGLASTFSFYVGHHMSTIEGGAVCTDDHKLATMIRLVRAHGWDRNLQLKEQENIRKEYMVNSTFYSRYTFYDLGYNLRPTEMAGFLGNVQLQYLPEIIDKRQSNYKTITRAIFQNNSKYYSLRTDHLDVFSNFAVPIICKDASIRDELVNKCADMIEIRPVVGGDMTEQPFYKKYMNQYVDDMQGSNASLVHRQGLYFGNNPELTDKEIEAIINTFK